MNRLQFFTCSRRHFPAGLVYWNAPEDEQWTRDKILKGTRNRDDNDIQDHPYLAIFDHDGVLVNSLELHQKGWRELGKRENLPLTDEFIHATFGMTNPDIFKRCLVRIRATTRRRSRVTAI